MVCRTHKYADGGKVVKDHGAPLHTPAPGGTTRARPKPGDRDPNYRAPAPKKPSPAQGKKPIKVDTGVVTNASGGEQRRKAVDRAVEKAQTGMADGGSVQADKALAKVKEVTKGKAQLPKPQSGRKLKRIGA
jgi:hypothetical protein